MINDLLLSSLTRFYEKDDKCISCKLPDNATYITDTGCEFKCNNRFFK